MKSNKDDEATTKVNAPETKDEESSSEKENLETSKDENEVEVESKEEVSGDYLEDGSEDRSEDSYKKRYGDSTREYQALKKSSSFNTEAMESLEKLSKLNPNIITEIEKAQQSPSSTNQNGSEVQRQIDEALGPVKKVAEDIQNRERVSRANVLANFEKNNPKLFSPKATKGEKQEIRNRIGKVANTLVDTGMDFKEAVNRAYLTVNPKAAIQKGKDEAYLEGLDEEQAGFSSQTSTEGRKPIEPKYSKKELSIGDKMGVGKAMRKDK